MEIRIPESLFIPLLLELRLFNICLSEEELAENIVYLFSEEVDALLDDESIRELRDEDMEVIIGGILGACGAYNVITKTIFVTDAGFTEIWFSFTTSPFRSRRHMDFVNLPSY
jgi:hypothetical protein